MTRGAPQPREARETTPEGVADELAETVAAGSLVAIAVAPDGVALAAGPGCWWVPGPPADVVVGLEETLRPRWVWWRAAEDTDSLVAAGVHLRACWDLAAVHRLLHGGGRDEPATVWAGALGLPEAGIPHEGQLTLGESAAPDPGYLRPASLRSAPDRARLALRAQAGQQHQVDTLASTVPALGWSVRSESAAALMAVELAHEGLPVDLGETERILTSAIGPRPTDADDAAAARAGRDDAVRRLVPGAAEVDLRNPAQVRALLARVGVVVPDTRAWRLEGYRGAHPVVEALIGWRKAERLSTTYGYGWLDRHVRDGRLRGGWSASDGGAGRMTAQAGLHNLPSELRAAVAAEPGHLLVRADLGQVEPRVLAAVSGDAGLAQACQEDDLYAPVAARLGCDRPTAKVAVLAAMYGQTSGTAGAALRGMEAAYPVALRYLRSAEAAGRAGRSVRTYGGRLVPMWGGEGGEAPAAVAARGRFARNAVVQGAAAELFKAWAATVRAGLHALPGSGEGDGPPARIVLCLHDELLVHAPAAQAERVAGLVVDALAAVTRWWSPPGPPVRLVAEVAVVTAWSEAK